MFKFLREMAEAASPATPALIGLELVRIIHAAPSRSQDFGIGWHESAPVHPSTSGAAAMPRTKKVAVPGTTPEAGDEGAGLGAQEGDSAQPTEDAATLAKAMKLIGQLQNQVQSLTRNQSAQAGGERVELPDLADVMKEKPSIPVLTKQGWLVPAVHPTDRIAKV